MNATPPAPTSCLRCHARLSYARGLCLTCYHRAGDAVRAGKTTWAALEAAGRALPALPRGHGWYSGRAQRGAK